MSVGGMKSLPDWKEYQKTLDEMKQDAAAEERVRSARKQAEEMRDIANKLTGSTNVKADAGKARCDLLPPRPLLAISRVLGVGAAKYGDHNYRNGNDWAPRYVAAALRHLFAWMGGERCDGETGESHLAHLGACALILLEREIGASVDDVC